MGSGRPLRRTVKRNADSCNARPEFAQRGPEGAMRRVMSSLPRTRSRRQTDARGVDLAGALGRKSKAAVPGAMVMGTSVAAVPDEPFSSFGERQVPVK